MSWLFIAIFILFIIPNSYGIIFPEQWEHKEIEGSGSSGEGINIIPTEDLRNIIDNYTIPMYLLQRVYQTADPSITTVGPEEMDLLEKARPETMRAKFIDDILQEDINLENAIQSFQNVAFFLFSPLGCDGEEIWPSVYEFTLDQLQCVAFKTMARLTTKSGFTKKYFARAVHFGLLSKTPIEHKITEMNSFWNEMELDRLQNYEDESFLCGSLNFQKEVYEKIKEFQY
ncbi:unnamed protein product [Caenorhabditis bovis]|uniref:Uncharacterized protein n=1 Tax=Caenorhabditis bovis TaxID=2654633 RepID=A0A8S1EI62_9PELO|nr:unnamed protein product [Caenorhabditis bovis]